MVRLKSQRTNGAAAADLGRPSLSPLSHAIRSLLAGGALFGLSGQQAGADPSLPLPRPEQVLVLPGQGSATYSQDGVRGVIHQQSDTAILNWKSFDIGPQNSVEFKQPSDTSIALNRINEQANPSQILGELKANGQVYLYNPNGFVFGKNSRVNVNSLVATTLDVSDDTFAKGVTKVFDQSQVGVPNSAFEWTGKVYDVDHLGSDGKPTQVQVRDRPEGTGIQIEAGAKIATNAPNRRILIVAPKVENRGSLQADDGEVILAAAKDKLYLQEAPATATVTGLLVEVGTGGSVSNAGSIVSHRGNITLAGFAVNQNGLISATTSVNQNGTIHLQAREGAKVTPEGKLVKLEPTSTYRNADSGDGLGQIARVSLGTGSVTQVQPELGDPATALDEQAALRSKIEIYGKQVRFESGAQVLAPSGDVSVTGKGLLNNSDDLMPRDTRIDMAPGSKIDVSGVAGVSLPMERNVVAAELRGNELRDSPLQRNGVLRNKTVYVDVRKGTPLGDISTAVQRIGRSIAERSTTGGTVSLEARGAVVVNPGAVIDIAGGSVDYQAGLVKTTQLISNRRLVDISQASPDLVYEGIFTGTVEKTFAKWNKTLTWLVPIPGQARFEPAYTEGKDAGSLSVITEALKLDGMVNALTQHGVKQRTAATMPDGGSLSIDLSANSNSGFVGQDVLYTQARTPAAALSPGEAFPGLADSKPNPAPLVLDGNFQTRSGISHASITTTGKVEVAGGTTVAVPEAGSLSLTGGEVALKGSIDGPGTKVSLNTEVSEAALASLDGGIDLSPGSRIDVGGSWVNDRIQPGRSADYSKLAIIDAGSISLVSHGDINFQQGSELAADGGAWLQQNGKLAYGKGGSISLDSRAFPGLISSNLNLGGAVHAYAVSQGGSLSLTTNQIIIGESGAKPMATGLEPLRLDSGFLSSGGFGSYSLASNFYGVTVGAGSTIRLQAENLELTAGFHSVSSARSLAAITRRTVLPADQRKPVDLSLALHPPIGQVTPSAGISLAAGSSIQADPHAHVSLVSEGSIDIAGAINAPAGTIDLKILAPSDAEKGIGYIASQGIFLDATASLDARGTTILTPDRFGLKTGQVLPGGTVDLRAERGFIALVQGASIDVSGAEDRLNLPVSTRRGVAEQAAGNLDTHSSLPLLRVATAGQSQPLTAAASNGGTITLTSAEGVLVDGRLAGGAGGATALGGSLSIELDKLLRNEDSLKPLPTGDRILELSAQDTPSLPAGWTPGQDIPLALNGLGQLAASTVEQGGFASLSLKSNDQIRLQGNLSLDLASSITLDAPILSWGGGTGTAHLGADYVAVGSSLNRHATRPTTAGNGTLELTGNLIDLFGSTSLQGFGDARLASFGDLRLRGVNPNISDTKDLIYGGEWKSAGNLTLQARQIYPTTATTYAVNLTGADSRLTILPMAGDKSAVLSAGGDLTLSAADIVQGGDLKAPFGQIHFKASRSISLAPGSMTSVSGNGLLVPFGRTPGGLDWLYPLYAINRQGEVLSGDVNLVYAGPPEKAIEFDAPTIALNAGATLDISGGGDLTAFEFLPGLGGSIDVLNPRDPNVLNGTYPLVERYAVMPAYQTGYAPYDPIEFGSYIGTPSGLNVGDSVYLSGGGGLPAGEYALLPAHYALLPGAFLVTPQQAPTALLPGQQLHPSNGATVLAGYRKTTGSAENPATWSAFAVEPGSAAKNYSEYQIQTASTFFDQQAAQEGTVAATSVNDAGRLSLSVTKALSLESHILSSAVKDGRGGQMDVVAPNIAVVSQRNAGRADGFVELVAGDLNQLGMESLSLGASRSVESAGTRLHVSTGQLTVESGARLSGSEIILAATGQLAVQSGAEVAGTGKPSKGSPSYLLAGDAALLRVASGSQAGYVHSGQAGAKGDLLIQPGANLRATGSMLLDSSRNSLIGGNLAVAGTDLSIVAGLINLGETPAGAGGTTLSDALLTSLNVGSLALTGRDGINLYGNLNLNMGSLSLDAPLLAGFANPDARISAGSITLGNSSGKTPAKPVTGQGRLALNAGSLQFNAGSVAITGFDTLDLQGSSGTRFSGTGQLAVAAATRLQTALVSGTDGAEFTLDAAGFGLGFDNTGGQASLAGGGLGTHFQALADRIDVATAFALPSGVASFTAYTGDLNLLPGAQINLGGVEVDFGVGGKVSTPGGLLNLKAMAGNVDLASGSAVYVAGAGGAAAGAVDISAPKGTVSLEGKLQADGGGRLGVDAQGFGVGGFSRINAIASAGGFDGGLDLRQRSGDLTVAAGETVRANAISLSADGGSIFLNGVLDASGLKSGGVVLSADGQVVLASGSSILATSSAGVGGAVELSSNQAVAQTADAQGLVLKDGSLIDVSGAQGGGSVHLRAQRNDSSVAIAPVQASIQGADSLIAEAVKTVTLSGNSAITASQIAAWKTDTANSMTHGPAIAAALGGGFELMPGLEIRTTGDLSLGQAWDLSTWRYADGAGGFLPGFLTLRAGGNLNLNRSLSDGFDPGNTLRTDRSWSYTLVSGADFGASASAPRWSADRRRSLGTGNVALASGALVRTGTGDIDIEAGGNISLKDQTAAIYTAGRKDTVNPYGNLSEAFLGSFFQGVEFPIDGGNIRINAGGDIIGAASTQFIPDWQKRIGTFVNVSTAAREQGDVFTDGSVAGIDTETPTAWGIQYDFQQNLGTLGGGDVTVSAGGNIRNLQVMLPTTGKQVGRINANVPANDIDTFLDRYITNEVEVNGGGSLTVTAQGDIVGGQFYVGKGTADITALGNITGGAAKDVQFSAGPLFAIGDADFHVTAAGDLAVGAAYNPFALAQRQSAQTIQSSTFFGYTDASALRLKSIAGDIDFQNNIDVIAAQYKEGGSSVVGASSKKDALRIMPGTLEATALQGGITLRDLVLFPTAHGNLSLMAGGNIQSDAAPGEVVVNMSDADPTLFPSQQYPTEALSDQLLTRLVKTSELDATRLPKTPLHSDDPNYAYLVSRQGSIIGNNNLKFFLPKPAIVSAGQAIFDIGLNLQNMRATDVSLVQTGGDLRYHISRKADDGSLVLRPGFGVQVQGPGQLHVLAGKGIDLGSSDGITSIGNLQNPALDEMGASLAVLAGLGTKPDFKAFLEEYLGAKGGYSLDEMANPKLIAGPLDLKHLTEDQQRELALLVFFNELKLSSQEAADGKGYERGSKAIAALFPEDGKFAGDIKLFFSRIHTLDGGNIDLLVPGGLINAGLASAFTGQKDTSQLGVVTQRGGAVLSYTLGDFQVNQSRVFAIASSPADYTPRFQLGQAGQNTEPYKDIVAWSAQGSIDAGRGSKGALSVSGGKKSFDQKGNLTDDVQPTIDGSGIRAQVQGNNEPGNVYLAAPKGIVDAGEAGIGGNQVTIAATAIVGATNIQTGSGGLSSNVSTTSAPVVAAPAAASSAAASASQMAQQSTADSATKNGGADAAANAASGSKLSIVTAELVGIGDYSVNDIREGKHQGAAAAPEAARPAGETEEEKKKSRP